MAITRLQAACGNGSYPRRMRATRYASDKRRVTAQRNRSARRDAYRPLRVRKHLVGVAHPGILLVRKPPLGPQNFTRLRRWGAMTLSHCHRGGDGANSWFTIRLANGSHVVLSPRQIEGVALTAERNGPCSPEFVARVFREPTIPEEENVRSAPARLGTHY